MTLIPYDPWHDGRPRQGTWHGARRAAGRTAQVACPGCGRVGSLSGHTIAADGTVSPSLVCPYDCGFHEFVTLEGWTA